MKKIDWNKKEKVKEILTVDEGCNNGWHDNYTVCMRERIKFSIYFPNI